MKKDGSKKNLAKKKKPLRKKSVSGYVPCLPEYEGDLSNKVDFGKSLTIDDFEKELRKSKRA